MAAGKINFHRAFQTPGFKPCFRSEDSLKTSERRVATSPPQQRVKSRGNAQVARARARHAHELGSAAEQAHLPDDLTAIDTRRSRSVALYIF